MKKYLSTPSPLPARRAYMPEGRDYVPEGKDVGIDAE